MDVIRHAATYRDRWGIDASPLHLGPVPASHAWEQLEQRSNVQRLVDRAAVSSAAALETPERTYDLNSSEARFINVGWQL